MTTEKLSLREDIGKALKRELKALSSVEDLTERMLVVEKAIKFEMMQHKIADSEFGTAFGEGTSE